MNDVKFTLTADNSLHGELTKNRDEFNKLVQMQSQVKKEVQETFQAGAKAAAQFSTELDSTLKVQMQQKQLVETITKKTLELQEAQKKAYSDPGASQHVKQVKELETELDQLKKKYKEVGDESKRANTVASQTMVQLLGVIDAAKAQLGSLPDGSAEYKKLASEIKAAEVAQKGLTIAVDEQGNAAGGSRAELKAYRETLILLKKEGLDQTATYRNLKQEAGELSDTIGDVNEEFKASGSDTAGLDRMVRGVQLVTNAMGLFQGITALAGVENEELQETLVRLNALMIISQSLQEVMTELRRKDNVAVAAQTAVQKAYAIVVGTSTGALKVFRIALAATGIGAILLLVGALIANWDKVTASVKKSLPELDGAKETFDKVKVVVSGLGNAIFQYLIAPLKVFIALMRGEFKGALEELKKGLDARANYEQGANAQLEAQLETARQKSIANSVKYYEDYVAVQKAKGKNTVATEREIFRLKKSALEKGSEEYNALVQEQSVFEAGAQKEIEDKRKAAADKAKQEAEKRLQERKQIADRILELEKQLAQSRIDVMNEGLAKEKAQEINEFQNEINQLNKQAEEATGAELQKINERKEQLRIQHVGKMYVIDADYLTKVEDLWFSTNKSINDILLSDQDKEIKGVQDKYTKLFEEIQKAREQALAVNTQGGDRVQGKIENDVFAEREKKLTEQQEKDLLAIKQKYSLKEIDLQEQIALETNNLLKIQGLSEEQLEELKEKGKLNILIEFAKKRIAILEKIGTDEAKLQALQLQGVIQTSQKELDKPSKGKTLFDMVGMTKDQQKEFIKTTDQVAKGSQYVAQALGTIASMYDENIKKREQNINSLNDEISQQEDKVGREKELSEAGYANNLEVEEQKLADLKTRKAKEEELLKDEQRKKAAIQKAQLIADTISQTSSLITAAAEIFAANSGVPFVGVAIALAAVATMMAGFAAIKAQAKTTTAETGRRVAKGNRHSGGGNKYVSMDGNDQDILEIEEGEWVVNRRSSDEFDPLLDAINGRKQLNVPKVEMMRMLKPLGIHLQEDLVKNIVIENKSTQGAAPVVVVNNSDDSKQWEKQNEILKTAFKKEAPTVEYTPTHRIERTGIM